MRVVKYVSLSVVVAAVGLVAAGVQESWSQPPEPTPQEIWRRNAERVIREGIQNLNNAESDEEKAAATQQLSTRLAEYFDADMARREEELRPLEERVQKLRAQIDLRKNKKAEIINLQLQLAVNEATGLGFFSGQSGDVRQNFGAPYYLQMNLGGLAPSTNPRTRSSASGGAPVTGGGPVTGGWESPGFGVQGSEGLGAGGQQGGGSRRAGGATLPDRNTPFDPSQPPPGSE